MSNPLSSGLRLPPPRRPTTTPQERTKVVQATDNDALSSRLSAVSLGYLDDPFCFHFTTLTPQTAPRKLPIINLGTYVRTTALDLLVHRFLHHPAFKSQRKQIISFGAGSDTRFFRLRETEPELDILYHELDFAAVTRGKVAAIARSAELRALIADDAAELDEAAGTVRSERYNIHAVDLRELPSTTLAGVDPDMPTLCISECCLIYLEPGEADAVFKWSISTLRGDVGMVLYEPIGGNDAFGKVMIQNLAARGIVLKTLKRYESLERQKERFRVLGYNDGQGGVDIEFASERWVEEEEKQRLRALEFRDEVEEWMLLARHYCVAWGWRGSGWEGWTEGLETQV